MPELPRLCVREMPCASGRLLQVDGVLDVRTYRSLRDTVVKAALDEPASVIIDVSALRVETPTAWSVFTSARWLVNIWPDVPLLMVCGPADKRRAIARSGVARYVPVFASTEAAAKAADDARRPRRRRAKSELPADDASVVLARIHATEWLTAWNLTEFIPSAATLATVLVENVLRHTASAPVLIVEGHGDTVTVAVEDGSSRPACRHEDGERGVDVVSGLAIVAAMSRAWGSTPTAAGKTVWAALGRENLL